MVGLTRLWWTDQGPLEDPNAPDPDALRAQGERLLAMADLVVPVHAQPSSAARERLADQKINR